MGTIVSQPVGPEVGGNKGKEDGDAPEQLTFLNNSPNFGFCLVTQFPLHCGHAKTCLTFTMPSTERYTVTIATVTELVVQNLHPVALYAKGGSRLSNCPNLGNTALWTHNAIIILVLSCRTVSGGMWIDEPLIRELIGIVLSTERYFSKQTEAQFRSVIISSHDWSSANQGPVFPDSFSSWYANKMCRLFDIYEHTQIFLILTKYLSLFRDVSLHNDCSCLHDLCQSILSRLPSRTCFFLQLMVTVCPESVSSQIPCTDPSTVNPRHTDAWILDMYIVNLPNQEILVPDWLITSQVTQITNSDWVFTMILPVAPESSRSRERETDKIVVENSRHVTGGTPWESSASPRSKNTGIG
eukprot:sb/3466125/